MVSSLRLERLCFKGFREDQNEPMPTKFPPYSYVPGGGWPHPKSHPAGHSYHIIESKPLAIDPARWRESPEYQSGIELFNAGYYWEAHEVWEGLWHAAGRSGDIADFFKALIKLAASGVKLREGVMAGAITHARRAEDLFRKLLDSNKLNEFGQDLKELIEWCQEIQSSPMELDPSLRKAPVVVIFHRRLETLS
jgi:predicted metal-dependent hydrolase